MRVTLLCAVLAGACTGTVDVELEPGAVTAGLDLRTDRPLYRSGDRVTVVLVNRSSASLPHNALCATRIQRYAEDEWRSTDLVTGIVCTLAGGLAPMEPGDSASVRFDVRSANLPAGHRYRLLVDVPAVKTFRPLRAISAPFTVVP